MEHTNIAHGLTKTVEIDSSAHIQNDKKHNSIYAPAVPSFDGKDKPLGGLEFICQYKRKISHNQHHRQWRGRLSTQKKR